MSPSAVEGAAGSPPGTLEKAEGAAEKALKAEAPPAPFEAAAKPLVEANDEKGEAAARFVVGAAFVKGLGAAAGAVSLGG